MKKYVLIIILLFLVSCIQKVENQNQTGTKPKPLKPVNSILINGFESLGEWIDDLAIDTTFENINLKVKYDSVFVYFNIKDLDTTHSGIDLYISNQSDDAYIFHTSSAHGFMKLEDSSYVGVHWGGQGSWSSNLVQMFMENDQQVIEAPDIFEYQISREFVTDEFKLLLEFKRPNKKVPESADQLNPGTWLSFSIM